MYRQCVGMDENDTRLVAMKDDMLKLIADHGESIKKYVHPKAMVPHLKNRGGSKMQHTKIWSKGTKILCVGVSLSACDSSRAIAFVEDGDKPSAKAHIELCKTSKYYANYTDIGAIEAASVGCGHWNQMLANICDEIPVPPKYIDNRKIGEDGWPFLDKARLTRTSAPLETLTTHGLYTTVIRSWLAKEYPELPNILQKALNIEHHIGEGDCV